MIRIVAQHMMEIRGRLLIAPRNTIKYEERLGMYGGLSEGIGMKTYFVARPNGLREHAETAITCLGPGPARKKEAYQQPGGRGSMWQNSRE